MQVDLEETRTDAHETIETVHDQSLEPCVGVEDREPGPERRPAQPSWRDVVVHVERGALALEFQGAAVCGDELVAQQARDDWTDQPGVADGEEHGASKTTRREEAPDERVFVLRMDDVGREAPPLCDERPIEPEVKPRGREIAGARQRGAGCELAPEGEPHDRDAVDLLAFRRAVVRRNDTDGVATRG